MSYAATMTWEMDGFRIVRSRPRPEADAASRLAKSRHESGANPGTEKGQKAPAGTAITGTGRMRIAERALEGDWQVVVQRCLDGDSGAWTELVKAHHRRVYAICYRFTGSTNDAEDLTQDVFLKVYGNLAAFDLTRGSFQTWITTLTRNLLVDHFRRTKQQRVTDSMDAGWDETDDLTIATRLAAEGPTQHDRAAQKEIAKMVQEALTRISPELREAVILRDLQDMDYKEIAQALRIPEGTVKSRISRGRAELARLLDKNKGQVA
ncbi:MAG TPA: sigma-70 family RNA polymerase sigma factor [Acidobacteriaceae bacterium]|nr:sigma-70 family RNA polymerase sigma factor [Acidobacteriaceae bacterium]